MIPLNAVYSMSGFDTSNHRQFMIFMAFLNICRFVLGSAKIQPHIRNIILRQKNKNMFLFCFFTVHPSGQITFSCFLRMGSQVYVWCLCLDQIIAELSPHFCGFAHQISNGHNRQIAAILNNPFANFYEAWSKYYMCWI